jgi:hypothetical protein
LEEQQASQSLEPIQFAKIQLSVKNVAVSIFKGKGAGKAPRASGSSAPPGLSGGEARLP